LADHQVNKYAACSTPTATLGKNQHSPLHRLTPTPQKTKKPKTKKPLNIKQATEKKDT
jgi:hypothetical protein